MFTEEEIENYNKTHDKLDKIIGRITYLYSLYGKYLFNYQEYKWEFVNGAFEVTATEYSGCYEYEEHNLEITWDEINNVDSLEEKLKKERDEYLKEEERKKKEKELEDKRKSEDGERRLYEKLKAKYGDNEKV